MIFDQQNIFFDNTTVSASTDSNNCKCRRW